MDEQLGYITSELLNDFDFCSIQDTLKDNQVTIESLRKDAVSAIKMALCSSGSTYCSVGVKNGFIAIIECYKISLYYSIEEAEYQWI